MKANAEFKWDNKAKKYLEQFDDKYMYTVARITLDMTQNIIPYKSHTMRLATMSRGVRQLSDGIYYISSDTDYAKKVYYMNDNTTNWSAGKGRVHSQWFDRTWKYKKELIKETALKREAKQ